MNPKYASLYKQASFISISVILDHFKVKYDKSFDYLISCPIPSHIHQSNTPSFKVYKDTNSFYCFGCKASGGPAQLTMHMLGVSSLEEALDYLAKTFDLKTKSLAKSFLNMTNSIKKSSPSVSPDLIARERLNVLIDFANDAMKYKNKPCFSYNLMASIYDRFYYLRSQFINNIVERKTFDVQCDALFEEFRTFISSLQECQEKDYAIDVENL